MPVTRSEKRQRMSSEQSGPPSNDLAQTSELELNNSTTRPKKRSKKLPSGSDVSPTNDNTAAPGPKPDASLTAPQEEPRRSLRLCVTSSNKTEVAHTPELESEKSMSRSEKRSEQRRLRRKLQSQSEIPSSSSSSVESALKSDFSSYTPQEEPRRKNLRPRVISSNNNTGAPAPKLDMRSYNPQETGSKKTRWSSYESSASKIAIPDKPEDMTLVPQGEVGVKKHLSESSKSSSKNSKRALSPAPDMRTTSPQKESSRPKKPRLLKTATGNDAQTRESSAGNAPPRFKLRLKKPGTGPTLSEGNSAPSSDGISTPFSESLSASTALSQGTSAPVSKELSSSPLSESKSAPSPGENTTSSSEDKDSPLSKINSASYSKDNAVPLPKSNSASSFGSNSAPSSGSRSRKRAAPHPETTDGISPIKNLTPKKRGFGDINTTDGLSPEKQGQYRAEREKEPQRVAEQQKILATMEDFKKGFQDLLDHIRLPRKNSHMKKNPNEHMFALKLSPQLCLMAPSPRHVGIYVKDACFESTSEAMTTWVIRLLMDVVKRDGLAWGEITVELTEGGSLGKVSNWGFNQACSHKLDTCFINTNVEILFCRKTYSAIITYHHQWKCAGQYEVPSGDMTDVYQAPRPVRTDHTTTGGGRSILSGTGESAYGPGCHTSLAGPQFPQTAALEFTLGADMHTVSGRHLALSLADYLPANPYLPITRAPAPPSPQAVYGDYGNPGGYPIPIDPALLTPPLHRHTFDVFPAIDTPPNQPSSDPLYPPYHWTPAPASAPAYLSPWISPVPSPVQEQFTYPDPDIATEDYVANWIAASLSLPLEPGRGAVYAAAPLPVPVAAPTPAPATAPKKRGRKSRAKVRGAAVPAAAAPAPAAPATAEEMMEMMTQAPLPTLTPLGPSPSETLAALQSATAATPGVPVPAAYRHVWFLNGRGRVSKTRDNNPRCQRCRRRHWASCSRGQPCDECAKDNVPCVYGPGVGVEEDEEKGR
ncbi:hypothetical protein GMDG_01242 [Pseudogymnoascus destructans 20631-21]|uniref:Zn(2)-C6 fungal-type domain-containing protein n=1 Tax=Pseudogymnoascus destructans (strain ATCC MYA-4855 / 20631-21) TaxID=658429 RepID=L8FUR7_PSED2|nr:hypothetical protein GMDG_01242 [Pseudogymnoascus destructans 20631-21]